MSRLVMMAVWDGAVQGYGRPIFVRSKGEGMRSFIDEVNKTGDQAGAMSQHPDDYELHFLGLFDDDSGQFEPGAMDERMVVRGKDAVKQDDAQK